MNSPVNAEAQASFSDQPARNPDAGLGNGAFNEASSAANVVREHWRPLIAPFEVESAELLAQRQGRVQRMRHENGATYNPFDDPVDRESAWALDMIPFPLTAGEWDQLAAGIIQRAQLLDRILVDVLGPQDLLRQGALPAELIFANPRFLRPCHGIPMAGNHHLAFYAADLYRAPDGQFRVLRDYGANPGGLGYALENRIVISRVFADLYHRTQIRRLAPFFQTFQEQLAGRATRRREDPAIVLLSPGPESPLYFEHALLSRYLGYPLVEGEDLTVRNGRLFLKKLAGLEPVDAIFRHISDADSDPFALRRATTGGVAGLIQVAREQTVDLINPIGSGFIDTPALATFLPDLNRQLTGTDLILANHPTLWCGNGADLRRTLDALEQLTIKPAFEPAPGKETNNDDLRAALIATPHAFIASEPVIPSQTPVWRQGAIRSDPLVIRIFACVTDRGFTVMPGGLALTADRVETLLEGSPDRLQSKDIWVLSEQPVEPFSLMGGLRSVAVVSRSSDLPSRVADHLLWLGRYLERAEGAIRLLRSILRRLSGEARPADIPELPFLLSLLKSAGTGDVDETDRTGSLRYRTLIRQIDEALHSKTSPESVVSLLNRVQGAARHVRDRLSPDSWRVINRLDDFQEATDGDPLELLDETLFTLSAFSGLAMESMTRGLGWRFMDMGRRLERATYQVELLRIGLPLVCLHAGSTLEALLEVADSIMTYRARYRTALQLAPVMDLLLVDEGNPKSLAFQLSQLADHVEHLPRQSDRRFASTEERLTLDMLTSVRLLELNDLRCSEHGVDTQRLTAFLTTTEAHLQELAREVSAHYLTRIPTTPHFSSLPPDPQP